MNTEQPKAFKTRHGAQAMDACGMVQRPLAKPITPYWTLWVTPFGLLPLGEPESGHPRCCTFCEGSDHSLQSVPSG